MMMIEKIMFLAIAVFAMTAIYLLIPIDIGIRMSVLISRIKIRLLDLWIWLLSDKKKNNNKQ